MSIDATVVQLLSLYQLPALFFGAFFFGETVVITAAFLSAQGLWSPFNVFLLSLLGTITADVLWFLFGHYIFSFFQGRAKDTEENVRLLRALERLTGKRPFLALLFIKFLYGTRILTIIYLSLRKINFLTFLIFDTLGTIVWLALIVPIGWLAGRSIVNFLPFLDTFTLTVVFLVLAGVALKLLTTWLSKRLTNR